MKPMNESRPHHSDNDILFSRTVKAGKRVYYIDVKCDRHGDYYISLTESKRVREGDEVSRPLFEKHKIFLYQEDVEKFLDAFKQAAQYTLDNAPVENGAGRPTFTSEYIVEGQQPEPEDETDLCLDEENRKNQVENFRFDIDF